MTPPTPAPASRSTPGRSRWVCLAVLVLAILLVSVDGTVLYLALPYISRDLGPSGPQLLWIGDVYSFVLGALLIGMGALSDRLGRKRLLLVGAAAFGAASVLAAFAGSPGWLIAARALLGVAGATIMPSTLSLIRTIFPDERERSAAIGLWGAAAAGGAALGPLIGGVLLEHFWWGSVFLLNLPVMVLLLVLGALLLPESRDPAPGPWDVRSVLLSAVGIFGAVYAVKEGALHGLGRADVLGAAVIGCAALVLFARRQRRLRVPLLDLALFREPRFAAAALSALVALVGLAGVVFCLSQYLQLLRGLSPLRACLVELPAFAGAVAGGLAVRALVRRTSARTAMVGGLLLMGAGLGAVGWADSGTGYLLLGAAFLAVGVAEGLVYTLATELVLTYSPKEKAGAAAAVTESAYELGTGLGVALIGSVLTAVYQARLDVPAGLGAALTETAHESLGGAVHAADLAPDLGATLVTGARDAFLHGMNLAAWLAAGLLLVTAWGVWHLMGRRPHEKGTTP
ncbi:MFS transporter [Kitasatospora mediocidica]|uniref:MFS transporter n=1 Tax=Kitasatospora mediocidica TaxID=58352 RepID=UPI000B0B3986|nr:MFS transporter [Kitasatospora mediocidica]